MSLGIVNRAAQVSYNSGMTSASLPTLYKLVKETVLHQFEGFSFSQGLFGISSSNSLVNRAVVVTTVGLSIATYILHSRAHAPGSEDQIKCRKSFSGHSIIFMAAWLAGLNSVVACYALRAVVQFKNACTVLPYLDEPSSQPTTTARIGAVAYSAIKYAAMMGAALMVFKASSDNLLNGVGFFSIAMLFHAGGTSITDHRGFQSRDDAKQARVVLGQRMGDYVASGLFLTMVGMGFGGALVWRGGLSSFTANGDRTFYAFVRLIRSLSLGASILLLVKKGVHHFQLLDDHTSPVIKHFSHACFVIDVFRKQSGKNINEYSVARPFDLALAYSAKKNNPELRQKILVALGRVPADERALYFVQNLPFLDEQDLQDIIQTYSIQLLEFWYYLSPTQIRKFLLPQDIVLDEAGLASMQNKIDAFANEIKVVIQKYAKTAEKERSLSDEEKAEREFKIYEEIQTKHQEMMSDSSSIASLRYSIGRMEPEKVESEDTKDYVEFLKTLVPQLATLQAKMIEVEEVIESCTGDLITPFADAIGEKGVRADGCNQIFVTLGRPPSEHPFRDLTQMVVDRGIKTKFDLIQKGILVHSDDAEGCKEKLIDFLLTSDQALPPIPAHLFTNPLPAMAIKIYRCVANPFFTGLQIYLQPAASLTGVVFAFAANSFILKYRPVHYFLCDAIDVPEQILDEEEFPIASRISLHQFVNAQITMTYFLRFGFIPAFIQGTLLPHRIYKQLTLIRQILRPT